MNHHRWVHILVDPRLELFKSADKGWVGLLQEHCSPDLGFCLVLHGEKLLGVGIDVDKLSIEASTEIVAE